MLLDKPATPQEQVREEAVRPTHLLHQPHPPVVHPPPQVVAVVG